MYNKFLKNDKGFTGLEAAIVLIAFVVVAAVFSYVMLGAGFFTTQKSQEVVHTGVTQASSSVAVSGDVIARGISGGGKADEITFYLASTAGGTPVDLDKTTLTYTDNENFKTQPYALDVAGTKGAIAAIPTDTAGWTPTLGWVYTGIIINDGSAHGDNLLSQGEKYKVVVNLTDFTGDAANLPLPNEKFTIQIKPPEGATLAISRTLPPALAANEFYPVY